MLNSIRSHFLRYVRKYYKIYNYLPVAVVRGRDRMVVGFSTTSAISTYHHWSCEFESRSGEVYSIQHYVIKFVSDLRQVNHFLRVFQFSPPIKLTDILLKDALNTINHLPLQPSFISIAQQNNFFNRIIP